MTWYILPLSTNRIPAQMFLYNFICQSYDTFFCLMQSSNVIAQINFISKEQINPVIIIIVDSSWNPSNSGLYFRSCHKHIFNIAHPNKVHMT